MHGSVLRMVKGAIQLETINKKKELTDDEVESNSGKTKYYELVDDFVSLVKSYSNIKVEGIYTHLSSADYDDEYTLKQLSQL